MSFRHQVGLLAAGLSLAAALPGSLQTASARSSVHRPRRVRPAPPPNLFSSRRRSRYWLKRCAGKGRALTRAEALGILAQQPITLAEALVGGRLLRLTALSDKALRAKIRLVAKKLGRARAGTRGYLLPAIALGELERALALRHRFTARGLRASLRRARSKALTAKLKRQLARTAAAERQWNRRALKRFESLLSTRSIPITRAWLAEAVYRAGAIAMDLAAEAKRRKDVKAQLRYTKIMVRSFNRLLRKHPRSAFVSRAVLAKGGYYFQTGHYKLAAEVFRGTRRWSSRLAPYAMYMLGWSLFRFGKPTRALIHLRASTRSSRSSKPLVAAARRLLPLVASHRGLNASKALHYFRNTIKGRRKAAARRMLRDLGAAYVARKQRKAARRFYRYSLTTWPSHKAACSWVRTLEGQL